VPLASRKKPLIDNLVRHLFNKGAVERALARLTPRQRQVLDRLYLMGPGEVHTTALKRALLRAGIVQERKPTRRTVFIEGDPYKGDSPFFEDIIARLTCLGLVLGREPSDYSSVISGVPPRYLFIPPQVRAHIPEPPPPPITPPTPTRIQESSARTFQRDLYLYWSYVRAHPLKLTTQGRLRKKDLEAINATLLVREQIEKGTNELDYPRLVFLRHLATALGLLKRQHMQVRAAEHPPFIKEPPAQRVKRCFVAWLEGDFWNEILSIPGISVRGAKGREARVPQQIVKARQRVIAHLKRLPAQGWVDIEQLIEDIRATDYEFLFSRQYERSYYSSYYYYSYQPGTPYSYYGNPLGWEFSPSFHDEAEGWDTVEVGFIMAIIREPLYWLGLVDLGYKGELGEPIAYRLTPLGAWVMGLGPEVEIPTGEGRVIVQPNFQIFALDPISDATLATLDEFAERVSAERAVEYKLTQQSVYKGQQAGWTAAKIIGFLEQASGSPLPQNVVRTLEEWDKLHHRIVFHRRVNLCQTATPELMDELLADEQLRSLFVSRPAPTAALVVRRKGAVKRIVQRLQERGYPPLRTFRPEDACRPSLTIEMDGRVRFAQRVPSIFLLQRLEPFTERTLEGEYYITEKSVQRALRRGLTVPDILRELKTLHRGPLPCWLEIAIKAWGKYYGDGAVQTVTLLQVKDEAILQELCTDPELRHLIAPFRPRPALAIVRDGDLDELRRLLDKRGISLDDKLITR